MSEEERLQLENELLMTCSKAQAINKYIYEFEECSRLSELWCKSQQEKQQLKERINKAIEYMTHYIKVEECNQPVKIEFAEVIKILDKVKNV